jgi:hypothetical protein
VRLLLGHGQPPVLEEAAGRELEAVVHQQPARAVDAHVQLHLVLGPEDYRI